MKDNQIGMFVILAISVATAITGTAAIGLATPAFANDDGQKCKENGDDNCNKFVDKQKAKGKNYCEIENENKKHSDENTNLNELECINSLANLDETALLNASVFDVTAD